MTRLPRLAAACVLLAGVPLSPAAGASVSGSVRVLKKHDDTPLSRFSNAVVWLSGVTTPAPTAPITVSQQRKKFRPRVLPVVQGQVVHFLNQDPIEHNVFSTDRRGPFDLGRYPKGEYRPVTFDRLGIFKVYCDIHKSMILDVIVLENRYFDVTDEDGVFTIEGVPPGSYRLNVWHVYGGTHEQALDVGDEPVALEAVTVKSTRVIREIENHANKRGERYREKHRY